MNYIIKSIIRSCDAWVDGILCFFVFVKLISGMDGWVAMVLL